MPYESRITFSLRERALYGFSLAHPNGQHSRAPLCSETIIKRRKGSLNTSAGRDTTTVDLTAETATRGRPRRGHAGQRAGSRSGVKRGSVRFHHTPQKGAQRKNDECFISDIFHLIFFGLWLTVGN